MEEEEAEKEEEEREVEEKVEAVLRKSLQPYLSPPPKDL